VLVAHTSGETPTEITLCTGTYAFDTPINVGDKAIDVRCIISEGGSCILDGQDASRIFSSIDANFNLNFQDLTFKAGKPTVSAELLFPSHSRAQRYEQLWAARFSGGAVLLFNQFIQSSVTFKSCIFSDNNATVRLQITCFSRVDKPYSI
jgi:hypothetical protein